MLRINLDWQCLAVALHVAKMLLQRNEKTYILLYHLYLYQYQHNLPKAYQQMLDLDKVDIQKHLSDILLCYLFLIVIKQLVFIKFRRNFIVYVFFKFSTISLSYS